MSVRNLVIEYGCGTTFVKARDTLKMKKVLQSVCAKYAIDPVNFVLISGDRLVDNNDLVGSIETDLILKPYRKEMGVIVHS